MAIYRTIQMSFWTDTKVLEDFEPDDKFLFLYFLTNPHTNLAGCYEIGFSQMLFETGYSKDKIKKIIERLENVLKVIRYDYETKELLIVNWYRHNWTSSEKFRKPLLAEIEKVKNNTFRDYLSDLYNGIDTVLNTNRYGMDRVSDSDGIGMDTTDMFCSVTDTVSNTNTVKDIKHKYGEYNHVLLTDRQYDKLVSDYGEQSVLAGIENVDRYIQKTGKKYKDHNLVLRDWGIKTPKLEKPKQKQPETKQDDDEEMSDEEWLELQRKLAEQENEIHTV